MLVLDSSAVLAVLQREHGYEAVLGRVQRASISTVNLAEVVSKLRERGLPEDVADASVALLELQVHPFTISQARRVGHLRPGTRALGLSLGDRACLALAAELGATALTGDRDWLRVPPELLGGATVVMFR